MKALRLLGLIATAIGATAIGAFAIGALAIGALAVGTLAIKRMKVLDSEFDRISVRELTVEKLIAKSQGEL